MGRLARAWGCPLLLAVLLAACDGDGSGSTPAPSEPAAGTTTSPGTVGGTSGLVKASDFDPADFDPEAPIDNTWFPLIPGTQFVYEGSSLDDGERVDHRVVFTVSDMTKEVAGVWVTVAWDRDFTEGVLVEEEIAFFAQDRAGNVWHLGQYPEEYEGGKLVKSPGWIAGEAGARAGIAMKAEPKLGAPSYSQGFAPPPINWDDRARAYRVGIRTCVPVACYDDVLVTEEFEPSIPGAFQLKYYAPDVGNVRVGWRGKNDKDHEVLVLTDLLQLDETQMQEVRERVTALDENAFRRIEGYDSTSPVARA